MVSRTWSPLKHLHIITNFLWSFWCLPVVGYKLVLLVVEPLMDICILFVKLSDVAFTSFNPRPFYDLSGASLFSFTDVFGVIHSTTDMEVAEHRTDITCQGDLSSYRASNLDHITSSNKEKTVWDILLHTPSIHGFLVLFLFHAGDRHFYANFPGIFLFGHDKLLRIMQSKPKCILFVRIFPFNAIEPILPKDAGNFSRLWSETRNLHESLEYSYETFTCNQGWSQKFLLARATENN